MASNDRINKPLEGYFSRVDTSKPCIGIVKDNRDDERMGRLKVWIRGSTAPESDPNSWIWVNYCSPFAGATPTSELGGDYQNFDDTQTSYGIWATGPDIDNQVIVLFVDGDIRCGYAMGGIFHKNMNSMVPGIAAGSTFQENNAEFSDVDDPNIPAAEYNKLSLNPKISPYYQPLAEGLLTQGLLGDPLRGAGSSSARRESPSQVAGWLTPQGNQFVMDDGTESQLIRLRTQSGTQILLSETDGSIYLISRDGNNWVSMNNDGYIDVYAAKDVSIRSEGNINLRANKDINIEAGGAINLKSQGTDGIKIHAPIGDFNLIANNVLLNSVTDLNIHAKNDFNSKADSTVSYTAGQSVIFYGTTITSNTIPGNLPVDAVAPDTQQLLDLDIQLDSNGNQKLVEQNLETIVPRVPYHEPWPDHAVALAGTRDLVEEGDTTATLGSVSNDPQNPLPLVGTPSQGMAPGVYQPNGYSNGQPVYQFIGSTTELLPLNKLNVSDSGVTFIAGFEGFRSNVYNDAAGKATIGYGHLLTATDSFPDGISQDQALALLKTDAQIAVAAIRKYLTVPLTQAQFDALTSFVYNVGTGAFQKSTLVSLLNGGSYSSVPTQLTRWNKAGGQVLAGLTRRRRAEGLLFSTPAAIS